MGDWEADSGVKPFTLNKTLCYHYNYHTNTHQTRVHTQTIQSSNCQNLYIRPFQFTVVQTSYFAKGCPNPLYCIRVHSRILVVCNGLDTEQNPGVMYLSLFTGQVKKTILDKDQIYVNSGFQLNTTTNNNNNNNSNNNPNIFHDTFGTANK